MMQDILHESEIYQLIMQEGLEKGLERGRQEGKLEGLQETLLALVQARFPKMIRLTKGLALVTEDPETLQNLILKVSMAQTSEEARNYLLEVGEDSSN